MQKGWNPNGFQPFQLAWRKLFSSLGLLGVSGSLSLNGGGLLDRSLSLNGRSLFFGNLGGGFSFLHNSLLGNRLGDELDHSGRSGIANARGDLDDTGVATFT